MDSKKRIFLVFIVALAVFYSTAPFSRATDIIEVKVTTPSFENGQTIPVQHTCDGKNISPALRWSKGPPGTQSYAVMMEDPDAPAGTWTHWILYNLPPTVHNLPKAVPAIKKLANAERHGMNDFGKLGYGGPCPPGGEHRYFFRMYALDIMLRFKAQPTRKEFLDAIQGHVLTEGQLMGRYSREKK